MRDMLVPQPDTTLLEGNHVLVNCGEFAVLLAHLKEGSVRVAVEDYVEVGQKIAEVGNSGQTFEPHLHIHVQRLAHNGESFVSGEPLHVTFNSVFPVRNLRIDHD